MNLILVAGFASTVLFAVSYLPMLRKAARTKDLASYSFSNIAMSNLGNATYSIYVFSLPVGPIWFLHTFYLVASVLMLVWFVRYRHGAPADPASSSSDLAGPRITEPEAGR